MRTNQTPKHLAGPLFDPLGMLLHDCGITCLFVCFFSCASRAIVYTLLFFVCSSFNYTLIFLNLRLKIYSLPYYMSLTSDLRTMISEGHYYGNQHKTPAYNQAL